MRKLFQSFILFLIIPVLSHCQFDTNLSIGSMWIDGDVDNLSYLGSINSVDLSVEYQLKNHFYFSGSLGYGRTKGLEQYNAWTHISRGGGLIEPIYADYESSIYPPHHLTKIISANLGLTYKKYLFHDRLVISVGYRAGISNAKTYLNLYDKASNIYNFAFTSAQRPSSPLFPESAFDTTFESKMDTKESVLHHGPLVQIGVNIFSQGYIGIRYTMDITNSDYLDGITRRTALDRTNNNDFIQRYAVVYTHRFGTFHW